MRTKSEFTSSGGRGATTVVVPEKGTCCTGSDSATGFAVAEKGTCCTGSESTTSFVVASCSCIEIEKEMSLVAFEESSTENCFTLGSWVVFAFVGSGEAIAVSDFCPTHDDGDREPVVE